MPKLVEEVGISKETFLQKLRGIFEGKHAHKEPKKMPIPIKNAAGMTESNTAKIILTEKIEGSMMPPTKKKNTDCTRAIGNNAKA